MRDPTSAKGTSGPENCSGKINGRSVGAEPIRSEITRLVIQALQDLGHGDAAALVQSQSGISAQSSTAQMFRSSLLAGEWDVVERILPTLGNMKSSTLTSIRFLVREQKYLEMLETGNIASALHILRHELATLNCNTPRLHMLTSLVMFSDLASLQRKAEWDGTNGTSRGRLLQRIQQYLPAAVMLPENRLFGLVDQALQFQRSRCVYHNCGDDENVSLLFDHTCDSSNFPTQTQHVLREHTDEVFHISFSHNGHFLASASKDGTAIVYNALNSFKVVHRLEGHEDAVSCLAWSPDDNWLLTCSNDHYVRLHNLDPAATESRKVRAFSEHSDSVTCCAWLPDNRRFVTGGLDKNILLHSVEGQALHRWTGARATDLAVTSDGSKLLVVSNEDKCRAYDLTTPEKALLFTIKSDYAVTSIALSPDNRRILLNLVHRELHLYSMDTQRLESSFKERNQGRFVIRSCFGGRTGNFIATGAEDNDVYIWHVGHPDSPLQRLGGHTGTVNSVAWNSVDPQMLASCSDDKTIRIWTGATQQQHHHHHGKRSIHKKV